MSPTPTAALVPVAPRNEDLILPQPEDVHPCSGWCRVIENTIFLEINRIAATHSLTILDEVDEDRYIRSLAPCLRAVKEAWTPENPYPLKAQLRKVQAEIREFDRWRRKPSAEELLDIVYAALGQERPHPVSGGDAQARTVVVAPTPPARQIQGQQGQPSWLREFAQAVGPNELAQKTFIVPLLNMSEPAARAAIAKIAEGTNKGKATTNAERMVHEAQKQRRKERRGYVDGCLRSVKSILAEMAQEATHEPG